MNKGNIILISQAFFIPIIFFSASLYLLGFSLNGVNIFGFIDFLIPFERALCFVVSICMFVFFLKSIKIIFQNSKEKEVKQ
jgi:uncharacterized membrane protein